MKTQALSLPYALVLASTSPRRKELMSHLGLPFAVVKPDVEECRQAGEDPYLYASRNAREKALWVAQKESDAPSRLVIGADTIGILGEEVLEKPRDAAEATQMLSRMSGRSHRVVTALALVCQSKGSMTIKEARVETEVFFKVLLPEEISYYVATGEPLDKAGSYGIQGIGGFLVERIIGSYSNVVGLPLAELAKLLRSF